MKTDRLIGITMYLLNRETVSASALAERFEVSKRTIQRDIDALNRAGIPILSTYGAEGGYAIADGFRPAKQLGGFDDYVNILIALKGLNSAYSSETINSTLERAMAALPGGEQRLFLDFAVAREGDKTHDHLRLLERAIHEKTTLSIDYSSAEGELSTRVVEPLALSFEWYAWYLFAYCTKRRDYRRFKLARIMRCEPAGTSFTIEHGDIEQLMKRAERSGKREIYHIRLLCKKEIRQQALEYLNGRIVEERENGDFIFAMDVPWERMWYSLLLGFGGQITVLEPEALKTMLRQTAEEILSTP